MPRLDTASDDQGEMILKRQAQLKEPVSKKGKKKIHSNLVLMTFGLDPVGNVRGEMILKGQRCSRRTNIEGETI